ncbi:universal stress protein [Povalibacter sp.]|uniref:universal stress protein n=1 Tax=Povalibacter sp. TaxID=1962978 RepID=UPI002F4097CB
MTHLSLMSKGAPVRLKLHVGSTLGDPGLRILCATDLWGQSDHCLQKALWLAEAADAELMLLHVVDSETPLRIAGRRADTAHDALERRVRGTNRPTAISVRLGDPPRTISRVAREWRADLVILGSARPRLMDRFRASTAERVAIEADCTVLVVNRHNPEPYADTTVIAKSCSRATAIENLIRSLPLLDRDTTVHRICSAAPPQRTRGTGVAACTAAACMHHIKDSLASRTGLVVAMVSPWPTLFRLLGRNLADAVARRATTDVLIWPHRDMHSQATTGCRPPLRAVADDDPRPPRCF